MSTPQATHYTYQQVYDATLQYFKGDTLQTNVFVDKYALRDREGNYYEKTPDDMHWRLAREFARIEAKYPNGLSAAQIHSYLKDFRWIVPQGSPMFGIGNTFQNVSLSNCAVLAPPQDTMSSILETGRDMANLYKRRFGVGTDLGQLRPEGAAVSNAAITSTGAWSFADLYSYITRMVGQSGRRGALMLTMPVTHPDIFKFVTMKADLTKVTGANVSVRVTDEFMHAVANDADFTLRWPEENPVVIRTIKAKELFSLIAKTACENGEPGFLFWDRITSNLPLENYPDFKTVSTNPCGEIPLPPNDSCRLISIPIHSFVLNEFEESATFDWTRFAEVSAAAQRLADDLIDLELECLTKIRDAADTPDERDLMGKFIQMCSDGRRTGVGTHGLADALARLCIRYDSAAAIDFVDTLYHQFRNNTYRSSIKLAKERGSFPLWQHEQDEKCEYIQRLNDEIKGVMRQVGRRNGALLTNAPTGSVSILSENCSSGIEPVFMLRYERKRKLLNYQGGRDDVYTDKLGDVWETYPVFHKNAERFYDLVFSDPVKYGYPEVRGTTRANLPNVLPLPEYFVTAEEIDWKTRVQIQGTIQKYIDHSISSTLNLPTSATASDVENIYLAAWKAGCKGVTVYRDGSRDAQVLSSGEIKKDDNAEWASSQLHAAALQKQVDELRAKLAETQASCPAPPIRGVETTGQMHKATFRNSEGEIRKVYTFVGYNSLGQPVEVFIQDSQSGPELMSYAEAVGRLISLHLKNGTPVNDIVDALQNIRGDSISYTGGVYHSVPQLVVRRLAAASKPAEIVHPPVSKPSAAPTEGKSKGKKCSNCGELEVYREGGCETCRNCGAGKCG